jgi:hypothetical protein
MANKLLYGVCYSPTWSTYKPERNDGPLAQFSDNDFFNTSFTALWNSPVTANPNTSKWRGDLKTMLGAGFNLLRLYNWGPTRGWNGTKGIEHLGFLSDAYKLRSDVKVIVPVSNYFLSSDTYAWGKDKNGKASLPDSNYSLRSAPKSMQDALEYFIRSVIAVGYEETHLSPAVHSFSVGNEFDYNTLGDQGDSNVVDPTVRLARSLWWVVNLHDRLAELKYKALLTVPMANGDQGGPKIKTTWFQALVNGVKEGDELPNGTNPNTFTKFTGTWKGLSSFPWYKDWYYNSVNIYQYGGKLVGDRFDGLKGTLQQYDNWKRGKDNHHNWPGQRFDVPLLLAEIGVNRTDKDVGTEQAQFKKVTEEIAEAIRDYVKSNPTTKLIGYCLFEFNDEPRYGAQHTFGIFHLSNPPIVTVKAQTGPVRVSYANWPSAEYPVEQLVPVTEDGTNKGKKLIDALSDIFKTMPVVA